MLTEDEKWIFDLQGYLVLRKVVSDNDLAIMTERSDEWHALSDRELPPPLRSYEDPEKHPKAARAILDVEYADHVFDRLILNREIMRIVLALTYERPQHLLSALTMNTWKNDEIGLHGGTEGTWHNPANDYQVADGKIFATFLNAAVSLVDVPPGCGFVCIPGSHKSSFRRPDYVDIRTGPPLVTNVPIGAGDAVIFTEALCHGALPWTPKDRPRRTVFVRYSTSYASWSPGVGPKEEYRSKLSEGVYEMKKQAGFQGPKKIVSQLLEEIQGERKIG
ncbi:MAG: phytanoyl-CoA dioxygenase family protein [candidate division Zixibacteria bacterium]|nr:phytanoyl-CoA dioxygenase family protein [candidate division Zixibacteria bacterium]